MTIVARFFPNGEFSQGVDTSKRRRHPERRDPKVLQRLDKERRDEYLQWKAWYNAEMPNGYVHTIGSVYMSPIGNTYILRKISENYTCLEWCDVRGTVYTTHLRQDFNSVFYEWRLIPLVHQMVESCDKSKSRKKLLSMSKQMSRNIRNAVYLLEQQDGGKDVLSFLTLTLPSLSKEGMASCCQHWDALVKRFFDWLRIALQRRNIKLQHVYCTEIQSKRLQSRDEYAPHLHVVFKGRNGRKAPWAITPKQVRKAWGRCIAAFVSEPFRTDALENIQRIKYSASRYLSKYLSKGIPADADNSDSPHATPLRTQWGGMARSLSKAVRQATTRLTSSGRFREVLSYFVNSMDVLHQQGFISYYKTGFIPLHKSEHDGTEYGLHVSCGCLHTPTYRGGCAQLIAFIESQLNAGK